MEAYSRTGRVRGLLCGHCNKAIGLLRDDPILLTKAAQYLGASMARQKDPVGVILKFFEEADLAVATTVLGVAKLVLAKRQGPKTKRSTLGVQHVAKTPGQRSTPTPPVATGPTDHGAVNQAPPPAGKPPRTRKAAIVDPLKDVALPGIAGPGPVASVGD
jgi:hypothetical protein